MQDDVLLGLLSLRGEGNPAENLLTSSWVTPPAPASTTATSTSTIHLPSAATEKKKRIRVPQSYQKVYCEVQENDVLLGRGGRSNAHNGNRVYRQRILEYQAAYKQLDVLGKKRMSENIVEWVKSRGGRFLAYEKTPQGIASYYVATDEEARQKVCQGLREDHTPLGRAQKKARLTTFGGRKEASEQKGALHRHGRREVAASSFATSKDLVLGPTTASTSPSVACPSLPTIPIKRTPEYKELQPNERTYINNDEINESDVLFGRGSRSNEHQGNLTYRGYVQEYKQAYKALDIDGKRALIQVVVQRVDLQGGRFLAVDRNSRGNLRYYAATNEDIYLKVSRNLNEDHSPEGRDQKKAHRTSSCNSEATDSTSSGAPKGQPSTPGEPNNSNFRFYDDNRDPQLAEQEMMMKHPSEAIQH